MQNDVHETLPHKPAVVADADGKSRLDGLATLEPVVRMVGGEQLAVGTNERVVAEGDAVAMVAMERRDDGCRRMCIGN